MRKSYLYRSILYLSGLLILSLGLTLNTKTGLGVSPIISVSYSISTIFHQNFGNMTFILYGIFVITEMILHTIRNRRYAHNAGTVLAHASRTNQRLTLLMDVLQLPLSLVITRLLNLFNDILPDFPSSSESFSVAELAIRIIFLCLAIILTGIGAALSLNMRLVPNPGDGIVQAIADCIHKSVGFTKNCFDLFCLAVTVVIGFLFSGHIVGIGLGTLLAMLGVGRVIALFNHIFTRRYHGIGQAKEVWGNSSFQAFRLFKKIDKIKNSGQSIRSL